MTVEVLEEFEGLLQVIASDSSDTSDSKKVKKEVKNKTTKEGLL